MINLNILMRIDASRRSQSSSSGCREKKSLKKKELNLTKEKKKIKGDQQGPAGGGAGQGAGQGGGKLRDALMWTKVQYYTAKPEGTTYCQRTV